jgi:hypothetical protein
MKMLPVSILVTCVLGGAVATIPSSTQQAPATPPEIVATYNSLADAILSVKKTEHDLVVAMLTGTYRHAEAKLNQIKGMLSGGAGQAAQKEVEALAALVSQLGNEGDNSVAAIRKRLLDGGFHHNAAGEQQGIFDEGFVIVTKAAKKTFLDAAMAIGKTAGSPTEAGLTAEWEKVKTTWAGLTKAPK